VWHSELKQKHFGEGQMELYGTVQERLINECIIEDHARSSPCSSVLTVYGSLKGPESTVTAAMEVEYV